VRNSKIEWTDHTFNPWIGCTKVSPGCAHCYAEKRSHRFPEQGQWGPGAPRKRTSEANWRKPLSWERAAKKARKDWGSDPDLQCCDGHACGCRGMPTEPPPPPPRVFCASLADWLDPEVPAEWLADLLALIEATPHLDWLLLTKRPELWRERLGEAADARTGVDAPGAQLSERWLAGDAPNNVWIGTSVEDQQRADERIPALLQIPARVRFLSCEPLLGTLRLPPLREVCCVGRAVEPCKDDRRCGSPLVHWVIAGGESGPKARPMHPDWARSLRDQCDEAGVPFLFKQWGAWVEVPEGTAGGKWVREDGLAHDGLKGWPGWAYMAEVGKKKAGRLLDGAEHNGVPS